MNTQIVKYFFESYFHQDWRADYKTSLDAVSSFSSTEPTDSKKELKVALETLLKQEYLPQDTIQKFGGNFKPESEELSVNEWIRRAIPIIKL